VLETVDKSRIDDGAQVRWVISGEWVQLHAHATDAPNTLPFTVQRLRQLGEITTLECQLNAAPCALLHLEITTLQAKQINLSQGTPIFLSLDATAIHIMPMRAHAA
jgi:molybdate transport system ATP-binding protein